ncbi:hypothetical protein AVEN_52503-1 [Araneus ventricosus]|uniref:Uncharacterized protein n=1 Tax=Araneus ventricosus TaxID=182803 RepID=A0A4Y2LV83_ARAVE|nr:hypothetical protein AVEN_52503-1 [Araneus ventricosus]
MKSGAGTDEVRTPKLWYYDMLSFLEDQTVPRSSQTIGSVLDSMPFGYDEAYIPESDVKLHLTSVLPQRFPVRHLPKPETKGHSNPTSLSIQTCQRMLGQHAP